MWLEYVFFQNCFVNARCLKQTRSWTECLTWSFALYFLTHPEVYTVIPCHPPRSIIHAITSDGFQKLWGLDEPKMGRFKFNEKWWTKEWGLINPTSALKASLANRFGICWIISVCPLDCKSIAKDAPYVNSTIIRYQVILPSRNRAKPLQIDQMNCRRCLRHAWLAFWKILH